MCFGACPADVPFALTHRARQPGRATAPAAQRPRTNKCALGSRPLLPRGRNLELRSSCACARSHNSGSTIPGKPPGRQPLRAAPRRLPCVPGSLAVQLLRDPREAQPGVAAGPSPGLGVAITRKGKPRLGAPARNRARPAERQAGPRAAPNAGRLAASSASSPASTRSAARVKLVSPPRPTGRRHCGHALAGGHQAEAASRTLRSIR